MKTSKLVTFGCSWTAGVGACYEPGMSNGEYESIHKEEGGFSFRSIITIEKYIKVMERNSIK